jgi:hypothetical protein
LAAVEITPESLDFLELTGRFGEKKRTKRLFPMRLSVLDERKS